MVTHLKSKHDFFVNFNTEKNQLGLQKGGKIGLIT